MANSAINISANAQEVINLKKRIDELKASLSSMRRSTDPAAYDKLNRELQNSSLRYNRLVGDIQRYVVAQQQAERATSKSSDSLTDLLKKGAALAGITFGAEKIRELGMEIVRVHGEMQQLNIAFSTMLKSQEKADTLMSGLKAFATDTPFGLMDSAKGAKQLLAYGTQAENIIGDLKMLGNVASGVSVPLGEIVYLYGTLRSQGRAYAVDIRQFAGRGIPIYSELAKVLKVNVDQVNELVSAGKVGFPQVEQAFKNMTSGGGMFEGLMEKQTASVTGQIEKLKDNIQFMFDAIGTSSEGAIYGAIDGASTLVENYQAVGEALAALIATYGTYKAATILNTAIDKTVTVMRYEAEIAELTKLLPLKEQEANADLKSAVASGRLTDEKARQLIALRAEIESRRQSIQSKLAEEQANLKALFAKRAEAKESLLLARSKTAAAKEELANVIATTQADVAAKQQKSLATAQETAGLTRRNAILLNSQKIQLQSSMADTIAQAEIAKKNTLLLTQQRIQAQQAVTDARELGIKGEKLVALKAEVAALNAKVAAAQREENAAIKSIATKRAEIVAIDKKVVKAKGEALSAQQNVIAKEAEIAAGTQSITTKRIETLTNKVNTLSEQENAAATTHNGLIKQTVGGKVLIKKLATDADTASTQINTAFTNANTVSTNMLSVAKNRLSLAIGKLTTAMASNPITLFAASAVALGFVVYKLVTATTIQEKAQIALNKALDDSKKKKDDLSNTTGSLVQVVNDSTKTTFDQISAYKDLQGLYPNLLKNMDIQAFKALGATEQQKLLNAAMSEFDISNQDVQLAKYEQLLDSLTQNIGKGASAFGKYEKEAEKLLGMDGFWDSRFNDEFDVKRVLEQTIAKLKEEQKQRQENLKEAELQAKPESERRKILEDQLDTLKGQESSLTESILKTGEYKRNLDGTISPISDVEKKFDSINDLLNNWNKNTFAIKNVFESANPVLNDLLMKMRLLNEEKQKLTGQLAAPIVTAVNKATLDDQIKAFKEYEEGLAPDVLKKLRGGKSIATIGLSKENLSELQDIQDKYKKLGDAAKKAKEDVKIYEDPDKAAKRQDKLNSKAETAAQKAIKLAQDQADRALKIKNDEIKSEFDLRSQQLENEEKYLNNQQDSFDKQQRQNELNYKKESLALEKHIQDLIETAQKAERDEWNQNNPKGSKTPFKTKINSLSGLSLDQQTASIQSDSLNNDAFAKATADTLKSLLNLYQDYNERKRAINEKYDQDLVSLEKSSSQARTEQEKAQIESAIVELKKKWAEALSSVNIDELKESINWEKVFGDLDKVSTQELAKLRDKLKEYLSSVGGSPQDLKTVTDAFNNLNDKLSQKRPVNELKTSYEEYRKTLEKVAKAKEKLAKLEKGTPAYLKAEKDLVDAQNENESARVKFAKGLGNTVNKIGEYLEAANALVSTLETMGVSISDSTKQALEGFGQILDGASKLAEGYAEKNPAKMIQGAITQIQGYYNAVVGLFGSGKTLTQKQIDAYKDLLSVLDDVIARQKELLQNSSAKESSKYYQDALDTIEKQREAAKKFLSDDFFESKQNKTGRTYGARERRYIQQDDNQAKLKALGIELKNQYDLLNLTKDEILLIQQKMPEFYANLFDETKDYLQLIVDTEDKTKELGEALQEALTGISFDSLRDSLDDLVQDVDTTFSDIGDSFEDHMRNAVLNFVKSSYLTAALQDWYDKFAEYAQSGSTGDSFGLTKDETDELRKMYEDAYNKAQGLYDSALGVIGVDKGSSSSSQSSSYGTSTAMDQETGGAILGRLTGVHEELIGIGQNVGYIAQWNQPMDEKFNVDVLRAPIESLNESCQRIELMMEENRNIALQTFYVVKDIKVDTSNLSEINEKLGRIESNTKAFKGK